MRLQELRSENAMKNDLAVSVLIFVRTEQKLWIRISKLFPTKVVGKVKARFVALRRPDGLSTVRISPTESSLLKP